MNECGERVTRALHRLDARTHTAHRHPVASVSSCGNECRGTRVQSRSSRTPRPRAGRLRPVGVHPEPYRVRHAGGGHCPVGRCGRLPDVQRRVLEWSRERGGEQPRPDRGNEQPGRQQLRGRGQVWYLGAGLQGPCRSGGRDLPANAYPRPKLPVGVLALVEYCRHRIGAVLLQRLRGNHHPGLPEQQHPVVRVLQPLRGLQGVLLSRDRLAGALAAAARATAPRRRRVLRRRWRVYAHAHLRRRSGQHGGRRERASSRLRVHADIRLGDQDPLLPPDATGHLLRIAKLGHQRVLRLGADVGRGAADVRQRRPPAVHGGRAE